uniref:Large ribosomal subunit protein uL11m n=1 Tax=Albugo laibachii Nc14 TaxID=890382 RepID=F0W615_9STRA|nr:50S ribosomal protein L11 putative [Albugo laibachii Nc14]|eukprot:CCA16557.1 50S ribosomal protein L11 putative [Albugo laibachii Nc14]
MAAIKGVVRLRVAAGKASPSPAIGQALGPLGVNMMEFCKSFNERTSHLIAEVPTPVTLTALADRTFEFQIKTPPTTWFLKKCAGITSASATPGEVFVGNIKLRHIYEIAKIKQTDENLDFMELPSLCKSIIGSAKSMGLKITP